MQNKKNICLWEKAGKDGKSVEKRGLVRDFSGFIWWYPGLREKWVAKQKAGFWGVFRKLWIMFKKMF